MSQVSAAVRVAPVPLGDPRSSGRAGGGDETVKMEYYTDDAKLHLAVMNYDNSEMYWYIEI